MFYTLKAMIHHGEQSGFVAECLELPIVTQGNTLDEVTHNLREAILLHLEGEDLTQLGLAVNPPILVTFEMPPIYAQA
ncbi:MAG: hypothetical protein BWK78_04365 [Thiotrichaceae bacterium IS1]|nr:MAG: hypothetical protein BWK78_04365 [Thiotrichaceae bacterium IS1]